MSKRRFTAAIALCMAMLTGCGSLQLPWQQEDSSQLTKPVTTQEAVQADAEVPTEEPTEAPTEITEPVIQTTVITKQPLVTVSSLPDSYDLGVEPVMQEPELPTGCEITSLTCLLCHLGFNADKVVMADTYLDYVLSGGTNYSFFEKYIGNPHADGYGCYSPVIVKAASKYLADQNSSMEAVNLSGSSKEELFAVIASGHPIVIWNTVYAQYVEGHLVWSTPDGTDVYWNNYEHCMLLSGYDYTSNTVTVCDPLRGRVQYDMDQFFKVYDNLMYQQAMTIY